MPEVDPERYSQAVMDAAVLESVMDALDGKSVSDFMESFPAVARALDIRRELQWIAEAYDYEGNSLENSSAAYEMSSTAKRLLAAR